MSPRGADFERIRRERRLRRYPDGTVFVPDPRSCSEPTSDGPCTLPHKHPTGGQFGQLHRVWPPANHVWDREAKRWVPDTGEHPRAGCVTFHRDEEKYAR